MKKVEEAGSFWRVIVGLFLGCAIMHSAPAQSAQPVGKYTFAIVSGDTPIGTHVSEFSRVGEDLVVNTTIEAGLKVLFVKVFEYRHRSREVWRDGKLVAFTSETNDDGKRMFVRAEAGLDGLRVESSSGSYVAPLGTMVGSLWNPATLSQRQLIHVENGRLEPISIARVGTEAVYGHHGRQVDAARYRLNGSLDIDLWYAVSEKALTKLRFSIRGHDVEYRPATLVATAQAR